MTAEFTNEQRRDITTIPEAVSVLKAALTSEDGKTVSEKLSNKKIDHLSTSANMPAFIYLVCNAVLQEQARNTEINIEERLAAEVDALEASGWFIPSALALVELRYAMGSLNSITSLEKKAILQYYDIEEQLDISDFEYHRSGTTSIIFVSNSVAVKIVRPVYLMDEEIADLDKYRERYKHAPRSPNIISAKPASLLMDYIRGVTLEEFFIKREESEKKEKRLDAIVELAKLVKKVHEEKYSHGDLNPKNIIVSDQSESGSDRLVLKLVDFGFNYSLTKPILSAQSREETLRYVAPTPDNKPRNAYIDDIYSMAVIMLDIWFGGVDRKPIYEQVHNLAKVQPLLASILEDALVSDPEKRLLKLGARNFKDHKKILPFLEAIRLACSPGAQTALSSQNANILRAFFKTSPLEYLVDSKDEGTFTLDEKTNKRINFFRRLSFSITALSLTAIVTAAYQSLFQIEGFFSNMRVYWASNGYGFTPLNASFWEILPGFAICVSFLLLATKYYLWIFGSLNPPKDLGLSSFLCGLMMRFNAFAYALPVAYCFLLDPKAWPFSSTIGLLIVALNNYFTLSVLKKIRAMDGFTGLPLDKAEAVEKDLKTFEGWGALVSWYAVGILVAGLVLVTSDAAQNKIVETVYSVDGGYNIFEYLLAFSVIGINFFKMQRENCGTVAPDMRNLIKRHIEAAKSLR